MMMRRVRPPARSPWRALLLATLLLGAAPVLAEPCQGVPPGAAPAADDAGIVPGVVLVRFRPDVDAQRAQALVQPLGLTIERRLPMGSTYLLRIVDGSSVPEALARLRALPEVQAADPDYRTPRSPVPAPPAGPVTPR